MSSWTLLNAFTPCIVLWGKDVAEAVHNATVLKFVARLNSETLRINPKLKPLPSSLIDKHFLRKHGLKASYGQK
jgi:L-ribulose-5-phosphate 4-epimerase